MNIHHQDVGRRTSVDWGSFQFVLSNLLKTCETLALCTGRHQSTWLRIKFSRAAQQVRGPKLDKNLI